MLTFSKKSKYALQALLALAQERPDQPVGIAKLAHQEGIPKKFLELILLELKNKGMLQSKKGKGGGYSLNRKPEAISLGEIIRTLEGPLAPLPCASKTAYRKCPDCADESTCGIRAIMTEVRDATSAILDRQSLASILIRMETLKNQKNKVPMYAI